MLEDLRNLYWSVTRVYGAHLLRGESGRGVSTSCHVARLAGIVNKYPEVPLAPAEVRAEAAAAVIVEGGPGGSLLAAVIFW